MSARLFWSPIDDAQVVDVSINGPVQVGKKLTMRERWEGSAPQELTPELERSWFQRLSDKLHSRNRRFQSYAAIDLEGRPGEVISIPWWQAAVVDRTNLATYSFVDDVKPKPNRSGPLSVTTMDVSVQATGASIRKLAVGVPQGIGGSAEGMLGRMRVEHSIYPRGEDPIVRAVLLVPWGEGENSLGAFVNFFLQGEGLNRVSNEALWDVARDVLPRDIPSGWQLALRGGGLDRLITVPEGDVTTLTVDIEVGEVGSFGYALRLEDPEPDPRGERRYIVDDVVRVGRRDDGLVAVI